MIKMFSPILAVALSIAAMGAASAQQANAPGTTTVTTTTYTDAACGSWQANTWVDNGTCANETTLHRHQRVAGTITIVKGHLVSVEQSNNTIVINDQPALNNQLTGKVAVGRNIVAHGYWNAGTFYATLITTSDVAPTVH